MPYRDGGIFLSCGGLAFSLRIPTNMVLTDIPSSAKTAFSMVRMGVMEANALD